MALSWLAANPRTSRKDSFGPAQRQVIDPGRVPDVGALLGDRSGPTPLVVLPELAGRFGLGEIRVKDESRRLLLSRTAVSELGARLREDYHGLPGICATRLERIPDRVSV